MSKVQDYWNDLAQQARAKGLKRTVDDVERAWRQSEVELGKEGIKPDNTKYRQMLMSRTKERVMKESKFEQYLLEMATPEEQAIAQKTARSAGAVSDKAIVPRVVRQYADKDKDVILDFGSGPAAKHALALRADGYDVTAYDFSESENTDPKAMSKKYTMVYASNVLNVQGSEAMLMNDTLKPIYKVLQPGGKFIANLPSSPLKGLYDGLKYSQAVNLIHEKLGEVFTTVERIKGSTPVFVCTK